jgi:hypothetical protein
MPSERFSRIALITLGLSASGVIVGGVLGALLVGLVSLVSVDSLGGISDLLFGAEFGAVVGAVLAPVAAWTLMRHVPIWRAIAETAIGTVVGAGVGMLLEPQFHNWMSPIPLGVLGFVLAAVRLRLTRRARTESAAVG